MSDTITAPARPAVPARIQTRDHHGVWPLVYILGGLLVGSFWLWGNVVQIQTSEAWMLQIQSASLVPHFAIFMQLMDFWSGKLSQHEVIADTWGWGVQIVLLICSVGIEFPSHSEISKRRAVWFGWGCLLFILLNSLADFSYGSAYGVGQQVAFVGITLMMSFFFGLLSLHLIITGLTRMRES
jgi:hypothetical protein